MSRTKGNIRRRKDTGSFELNYLDATGRRRWKSFKTKKAATAFLRREQAEQDAIRGGLAVVQIEDRSWEDLVALWEKKKAAKRSLKDDLSRIRVHLKPLLRGVVLSDITPAFITRIEGVLHEKVASGSHSVATTRKVLVLLGAMLRVAVREGWMASAPPIELPVVPERDYRWIRSREAIGRLLRAARDHRYPGLHELIATAIYTGMRVGELYGLQWDDVDFGMGILHIRRSYDKETTKSSKIRRIPLPAPLAELLRAWRGRSHSEVWVFPNERGGVQKAGSKSSDEFFHECRKEAGIERMTFHSLRHTFASHFMMNGGDIYRLQSLLGHSSVKVTERYAHLSPDAFAGDRNRLGAF